MECEGRDNFPHEQHQFKEEARLEKAATCLNLTPDERLLPGRSNTRENRMPQTSSTATLKSVEIEKQLAEALQAPAAIDVGDNERAVEEDVSSRELLQMAWDKAEKELEDLHGELRKRRQQFRDEERSLLNRINQKKRLQQELLDHAPQAATSR